MGPFPAPFSSQTSKPCDMAGPLESSGGAPNVGGLPMNEFWEAFALNDHLKVGAPPITEYLVPEHLRMALAERKHYETKRHELVCLYLQGAAQVFGWPVSTVRQMFRDGGFLP